MTASVSSPSSSSASDVTSSTPASSKSGASDNSNLWSGPPALAEPLMVRAARRHIDRHAALLERSLDLACEAVQGGEDQSQLDRLPGYV
jgi:hypothetical protein